jgi:uncharacterized membrane protein SpoIIM required for sporulation
VDLDAFVTEHRAEWRRLQLLAGRRRRRLTPAEVDELVMLYRRTATHLSVIRSRSGDPSLVAWLSRLVLQGRAAVAPPGGGSLAAVRRFFAVAFPAEVYRARRWWLGVAAGFLALSVVLAWLVATDPSIALGLFSEGEIERLVSHDFEDYYSEYPPQNFASLVWVNNTIVSAVCLAGGVLLLPTVYMLFSNTLNVGVVAGLMIGHGRAGTFFGLITVHGLLELTCVFVAGGVGLRVGWAWIAPGPLRSRTQALAEAGRQATVVAIGLAIPLFVSGLVEAFVTPSPLPTVAKLVIGAADWLAFLGYVFVVGGAAVRRGETGDVAAYEREALAPTV